MKELSLHILDIAQNSIRAGATEIVMNLTEDADTLTFSIADNGCGMTAAFLARVTDPFATTRTTRKVGLGIPLLKMAAEQTGGALHVTSRCADESDNPGTELTASFRKDHIDFVPLGDITETLCTLIHGAPDIDFAFLHTYGGRTVSLSTKELRNTLGADISLNEPEVIDWIRQYLREGYSELYADPT